MCIFCSDSMRASRVLLAQKIVGLLPKEDDTGLEETIEEVIRNNAQNVVGRINLVDGIRVYQCKALREILARGIRKALPQLTIEERFELAVAAGAVKLSPPDFVCRRK